MTTELKLLPCPFCGSEPKHSIWSEKNYHRAECEECDYEFDYYRNFGELVAAWNRRAESEPSKAGMPTEQEAHKIGARGSKHTPEEQKLFEAYMKGHCWSVGPWVTSETGGHYYEQSTRMLWAVWRDRAALSKLSAPPSAQTVAQEREDEVLKDALNTVLWLESRLPHGYGEVPHVQRTIAALNDALAAPAQLSDEQVDADNAGGQP